MFDYVKGRDVTTLNNDSFRHEGYCSLCKRTYTETRLTKRNLFSKILLEDIFLLINVIAVTLGQEYLEHGTIFVVHIFCCVIPETNSRTPFR